MKRSYQVKPGSKVALADYDPGDTGPFESSEQVKPQLETLREELFELQARLYADNRYALLLVFQGMDTSGKDSTIRHVMAGVNPIGCHVTAFKAPTEEEREHDFLWRIHQAVPRHGEIGIFNRSHYEDVLIVRVRELAPPGVWKERYRQINEFERILTDNGTVILKFFLHISKQEQKKRFEDRLNDPMKNWKFSAQDLEERKLWNQYHRAYEDALGKCSTEWAPWTIVPANRKWYRNLIVAETIVRRLQTLNLRYPKLKIDRSKVVID